MLSGGAKRGEDPTKYWAHGKWDTETAEWIYWISIRYRGAGGWNKVFICNTNDPNHDCDNRARNVFTQE